MKNYAILFLSIILFSCSVDNDEPIKEVSIKLNFAHNWGGTEVTKSDFNTTEFENSKGVKQTIERLRYLISRITLTNGNKEEINFDGYKLVDLSDSENLTHTLSQKISEGTYTLSFTFGFNNEDNKDGIYKDLNTALWNVTMLNGGYHFMQLDGKYKDNLGDLQPYNFHAIQAYDKTTNESKDTFFVVELGTVSLQNNATITINMDISKWFKTPNEWDLNTLNVKLMGNFEAQQQISENGRNVFSIGTISQ
ncbi:MbnP family protein [Tenacibaculum sp. nBUS_03]|uniref:MbnP family protein n=1 Tax=Tenacibaculum sp. nBUS_03 TaxID=3395320 RepID=UPI003EC10783